MKRFFKFGIMKIERLISILFCVGIAPIALYSYIFVVYFFSPGSADKTANVIIQNTNQQNASVSEVIIPVYHSPLTSLLILAITFISGVVLWRLTCEIIFIMVKYFVSNTNTNINE